MAFDCVVVTPERETFHDRVTQAILPAHDGLVGIQTGHAPLLTQIGVGPLRLDVAGGNTVHFLIDGGVAQVKDDVLTILTTHAVPAADIDAAEARAEYAEAEARKPMDEAGMNKKMHDLQRARAKQELAGKA